MVLLPEPFGPIRPKIWPSRDGEVEPVDRAHAAEVPRRGLELEHRHRLKQRALEARERLRVEQAVRPQVHRQHDQRAEEQVAPVAEEAQPLDQEALHEHHRGERAEHAREPAEDRVGDGEGGHQDVEVRVLDVGRVVRVEAAADPGDGAADGHRAHLHRGQVDADRLRRELVLADRAQHRAVARAVEPPQRRHHRGDDRPDEEHHLERRPAVLREVADLAEAFAAERADLDVAARDLVVEVEEEEPHALAEGERRDHQHQPVHAQRREADRAGDDARRRARPTASAGTSAQPASTVSIAAT